MSKGDKDRTRNHELYRNSIDRIFGTKPHAENVQERINTLKREGQNKDFFDGIDTRGEGE